MKKSIDNSLPYGCGGSGSRHNTSPNKSHILKKGSKVKHYTFHTLYDNTNEHVC